MAITSSAKRAIRVSARKRVINLRRLTTMKDNVRSLRKTSEGGDHAAAEKSLSAAYKAIDKAAKRGVIKKNTAARKKSRLVAFMKKNAEKPEVVKVPRVAKVKAKK